MSSKQTRSAKKNNETDTVGDENNESFQLQFITSTQLEKILSENRTQIEKSIRETIKNELSSLKEELVRLQSELESVTNTADNAVKMSDQLKKDCTKLQEENVNLKTKLQNITNEQGEILEAIEDRTNRQLRKTLVFKGIPEEKIQDDSSVNTDGSPKLRSENWNDTAEILAKAMSEAMPNTTVDAARSMVERCHRAAPNPNYKGPAPRPIFAAFLDWRDSERAKDAFRKAKTGVFADQKVGPRTSKRRDMALRERKRLLEQSIIYNGYVSHPARLMVKDSLVRGAKYRLHKDYSKEPVILG